MAHEIEFGLKNISWKIFNVISIWDWFFILIGFMVALKIEWSESFITIFFKDFKKILRKIPVLLLRKANDIEQNFLIENVGYFHFKIPTDLPFNKVKHVLYIKNNKIANKLPFVSKKCNFYYFDSFLCSTL